MQGGSWEKPVIFCGSNLQLGMMYILPTKWRQSKKSLSSRTPATSTITVCRRGFELFGNAAEIWSTSWPCRLCFVPPSGALLLADTSHVNRLIKPLVGGGERIMHNYNDWNHHHHQQEEEEGQQRLLFWFPCFSLFLFRKSAVPIQGFPMSNVSAALCCLAWEDRIWSLLTVSFLGSQIGFPSRWLSNQIKSG